MLESLTSILSVLIAAGGFLAVIWQLRKLEQSIQESARTSIYDMAARIKEVLLERPHLRPYVFGGKTELEELEADPARWNEALAIADFVCLYLEQIATQRQSIAKADRDAWCRFASETYQNHPLLQRHLKGREHLYSEGFWAVMQGEY